MVSSGGFAASGEPQDAKNPQLTDRFQAQLPIHQAFSGEISTFLGQALEIAVYRALCAIPKAEFFGRFRDLDAHDDSTLYQKEEPPQHLGVNALAGDDNLDFILRDTNAGYLGIECKNIRPWLYPDREEVSETLTKCLALNCVPVIIARRVPYVSFILLSKCESYSIRTMARYSQFPGGHSPTKHAARTFSDTTISVWVINPMTGSRHSSAPLCRLLPRGHAPGSMHFATCWNRLLEA
jgi:hypothetical protein